MAESSLDHQFNGDLLITRHDQELARKLYHEIYHVLDHVELREAFQKYDELANSAKLWVQRVGLLAVLLATLALFGSALTPLVHLAADVPAWTHKILFNLEVGGIIGVVIASGGLAFAKKKNRWLKARMMAEVLRLWHFQSLICRGKEIAMSCGASNEYTPRTYREARAIAFEALLSEWAASPDNPRNGQLFHRTYVRGVACKLWTHPL